MEPACTRFQVAVRVGRTTTDPYLSAMGYAIHLSTPSFPPLLCCLLGPPVRLFLGPSAGVPPCDVTSVVKDDQIRRLLSGDPNQQQPIRRHLHGLSVTRPVRCHTGGRESLNC